MGAISGYLGKVDGVHTVARWRISSSVDLKAVVASNTKKGTITLGGVQDWEGSYEAFGGAPQKLPNDAFTFKGSLDGAVNVSGPVRCSSVEIVIDIENGEPIRHTVNFSANGVLTISESSAVTDATVPSPPSSLGCKLEHSLLAATETYVEQADVRTITIRISANQASYSGSSSSGYMQRVAGPINVEVTWSKYIANGTEFLVKNSVYILKVYVTATSFWHFKWMRIGSISDIDTDMEGATIIGGTTVSGMCGFADVPPTPTPTEGFIKKPDATTYWP